MKQILLFISLIMGLNAYPVNKLTVPSVTVPRGGSISVDVTLENTDTYAAYEFKLELPKGVSLSSCEGSSRFVGHQISRSPIDETKTLISCYNPNESTNFLNNEKTLMTLYLYADESLNVGTELEAKIYDIEFSDIDMFPDNSIENLTFTITIGEPADTRVVIDEDATTTPEDATGVDVRVKRSIRAGTWNTICLPFAMTETQVLEAFGSDVELADFEGITSDTDADDNITGIMVNFTAATSIEANHPYLIKVSTAVTEFTVDGVDIVVEEEPSVDKDGYTVGKGKTAITFYNRMVGTYTTNGMVPNLCLFLSDGQFWYSTGLTPMKGLRAYFDFYNVLTDVEDSYSIKMRIGDITTRINNLSTALNEWGGAMYDVSGRKLNGMENGIIIINGKKVLKK